MDARGIAESAVALGAARTRKGEDIDRCTGVRILVRKGQRVDRGQPLAEIHSASTDAEIKAEALLRKAIVVSPEPVVVVQDAFRVVG